MMGKQLEGFLNASGPVRKAAAQQIDASLAGLGIASRAQVVALAQHLAQVEEKIDGLEDKIDRLLGGQNRTERA